MCDGLYEKVFEGIIRQLEKKGVIVKLGSIVDASLVKFHYRPCKKDAQISSGIESYSSSASKWSRKGTETFPAACNST